MPESPIRKLAPFAQKAKKEGKHIYHLNIGQPDIKTPKNFLQAVKNLELDIIEYSPSNGYEVLRNRYCQYFVEERGIQNIGPDDLLITTGASEGLFFTMLSILDEEDEIIIPEPLYANYIGYVKSGNINIRPIATNFEDNFALPSIDDFEKMITPKTKAILICNPNNPTGYVYSLEELRRLKTIALRHDLFIISDEVYKEFIYGGQEHHSIFHFEELHDHAILVDSFSKRFSACGTRIGVVASRNKEFLNTVLKFAQQRLSPPTIEQLAGVHMFDVEENYFNDIRKEYKHRRDTLAACLAEIPGVQYNIPNGAFYMMVKLPVDDTNVFCQWLLEEFEYENATLMVAPGSGFYATPNRGKDEVRIAYVLNADDIKKAIICLKVALEQYPGTNIH